MDITTYGNRQLGHVTREGQNWIQSWTSVHAYTSQGPEHRWTQGMAPQVKFFWRSKMIKINQCAPQVKIFLRVNVLTERISDKKSRVENLGETYAYVSLVLDPPCLAYVSTTLDPPPVSRPHMSRLGKILGLFYSISSIFN